MVRGVLISKTLLALVILISQSVWAEEWCTYNVYSWNTIKKQAVDRKRIQIPYSEISDEQIDTLSGCSVCQEDQFEINLPPLESFKVCRFLAPILEYELEGLLRAGASIHSITGYRVGKTRGEPDAGGNRTAFSNHSYGIAIDINEGYNGLYDNCTKYNQSCRLIRGGKWDLSQPESLFETSIIVHAMEGIGLKWGGNILGKQKDFMHFSPTGY